MKPVAIVGMGGVFPGAPDLARFWELVRDGRSAAREAPPDRWVLRPEEAFAPDAAPGTPDKVYSKRACFLDDESFRFNPSRDAELGVPPALLAKLDPLFLIVLRAGHEAWRSAKTEKLDKRRAGVLIGNIALPTEASSALAREWLGRAFAERALAGKTDGLEADPAAPDPLNRYVTGLPGGMLARALGLGGGSATLDAACASSLYAVKLAADELNAGRADAMLAGGASRPDCLYTQMGFAQLRALSPSGRCSPFDKKADGLVVGEGACFFVLKRLEDALAEGDSIHGVIRGAGLSNDLDGSLLAPSSEGQLRAMRQAYEQSGWSPRDVDLIECHATGTPIGDAVEFESLKTLWGEGAPEGRRCIIGSVKSNVGHLLTGAGAAGLAKVLLALREKTLPPTANFEEASSKIAIEGTPFRVLSASDNWAPSEPGRPRRAAVSAFGFGGINAHVLIEEWTQGSPVAATATSPARVESAGVPVAVVGMDARFGPWQGLRAFQERVLGGREEIVPASPDRWWGLASAPWFARAGLSEIPFAGYYLADVRVTQQPRRFRIPPKELQEMLPQQALMLLSSASALADAGIVDDLGPRTGIFVGIGLDLNTTNFQLRWALPELCRGWNNRYDLGLNEEALQEWVQALREAMPPALSANRTMGALGGIVASRIAREFRCGGPSFVLSSEESSGLRAIEVAVRALQRGEVDRALAGAVDLAGDPRAVLGMHAQRPFSKKGEARPFDPAADGCIGGEGAAALVLKRLDDAVRDGDRVYAVIRGLGAATGGRAEAPVPDERAYREALDRALREAGVPLHALGYLEAHASAVPAEDRMELRALAESTELSMRHRTCALGSAKADVGHAGAAAGVASFVKACLCLHFEIIPPLRGHNADAEDFDPHGLFYMPYAPQYWLRDRAEGPRRAGVASFGVDGTCTFAVLEAPDQHGAQAERVAVERRQPLGARGEGLFVLESDNLQALAAGLRLLSSRAEAHGNQPIEPLARDWWREHPTDVRKNLGLAIVARTSQELLEQLGLAQRALDGKMGGEVGIPQRMKGERTFFSPEPAGGKVAFIFPGSGNHFIGMGRGLSAQWPEILRTQDCENEWLRCQIVPSLFWNGMDDEELLEDARALIFGQVAAGTLFADLMRTFGVKPDACLGYSLGESAGFFGLRAWKARDEMYRRMRASTLFTMDLAGPCNAARKAWSLPLGEQAAWTVGIVARPAAQVRELLATRKRVYLLIVNTPQECVIGGQRAAVEAAAHDLGVPLLEVGGVTVAHCDVVAEVAQAYRQLHEFETTPPQGVAFYSGSWGRSYDLDRDSAAETILAHALHGLDFPQIVTLAYRDGARVFLEMGPGASCTRMVGRILGDQPHHARAACIDGLPEASTVLRMLAALVAERIPVDLAPLYGRETLCASSVPNAPADAIVIPIGGDAFAPPPPPQKIVLPSLPEPERIPEPTPLEAKPQPTPSFEPAETPTRRKRPVFEFSESPVSTPVHESASHSEQVAPAPISEPELASTKPLAKAEAQTDAPVEAPILVAAVGGEADAAEPAHPGLDSFPGMVALAQQVTAAEQARVLAHVTYLRFSEALTQSMAQNLALQLSLVERLRAGDEAGLNPLPSVQASFEMPVAPVSDEKAPAPAPAVDGIPRALNREQCLAFARGKAGDVLGQAFADADTFPTRVRLPDEPLMLVDRILSIEGEPHSMTHGRVVTEHDILEGDWYLDQGRIPTCIAVESGQADLFLSGFLGIDFQTRGLACYRLLDAVVTFHRSLPGVGEVIHYDIRIEKFFRQGNTWLFRFSFESTVNGKPLLSMSNGCAGFFTAEELAAGQGVVHTALDKRELPGKRPDDWRDLAPMYPETYSDEQLDALRRGDLGACFGPRFENLKIADPLRIPGGRMKLVHRIVHLDPKGGRFGLGLIRGEADIHPDDWFLTCHFVDDRVMPGTLMYECCMHTLRVYLLRMGWVCERAGVACEPVPGVASGLKCRGQVLESTKKALYEITLKEIGYGPEPYVIADALMYADGKPIVEITNMSLRMSGVTRAQIEALWPKSQSPGLALPAASASALNRAVTYDFLLLPVFMPEKKKAVYDADTILAFATGKPSEAFGASYKVFDHDRVIARLPGPPYQFLDRITEVRSEAWKLIPGGEIEAQYDVPQDAWYFRANRGNGMPFAVLLEIALQPCGWFSAYMGSALTSDIDLSYRNLGGEATQYMAVRPEIGTLTTRVKCTKLSSSGGMIIQRFLFEVHSASGLVYKGDTYFGFFSKTALAQQVGVRDAKIYSPGDAERMRTVRPGLYPGESPYPTDVLRMITGIDCFVPDGGPKKLGYIEGNQPVNPGAWFFKAHFYQDPVIPGSLGLESFLQLVRHVAMARWGGRVSKLQPLEKPHRWTYRGQVIPTNKRVTVQAWITHLDDRNRTLTADGFLSVDGRPIYQMNDFTLCMP